MQRLSLFYAHCGCLGTSEVGEFHVYEIMSVTPESGSFLDCLKYCSGSGCQFYPRLLAVSYQDGRALYM